MARGIPVEMDTYEEEDFQINIDRLKSLITPRTKALIINTPSNPTGSCLSADTLGEIAKIAEEEDLIVIAMTSIHPTALRKTSSRSCPCRA